MAAQNKAESNFDGKLPLVDGALPAASLTLFLSSGTTLNYVEVEHYDPYSDTWAVTCPALRYVTNFTATACHGKLYVIGSCAVKYNALTMQCYNPVIGEEQA